MLCLRDAACLGAHFGSRTPYERGSRGSGDPLESFLSVSDAGPARPVEIKKTLLSFLVRRIGLRPQVLPQSDSSIHVSWRVIIYPMSKPARNNLTPM